MQSVGTARAGLAGLVVAAASLGAMTGSVHQGGPPPAHTGGFGEPTCQQCHFDGRLNEPGGELVVGGVPGRYQPGRTYDLVVSLRRVGMRRAGFQLAARFADGPATGGQAGLLAARDERTATVRDTATGVLYVQHNAAGARVIGGAASWTVRWVAPTPEGGAAIFHVVANAANDDQSPLGDFIYATAVEVPFGR